MIDVKSKSIGRDKLSKLTGDDHDLIKFLEYLQSDINGPVAGGVDSAQAAADAAQATGDQATIDAATAQTAADAAQSDADAAQMDATYARNLANAINVDYVSKTAAAPQAIISTIQAASYRVAGVQVVGAQATGWTTGTGTAYLGAYAANTTYAAGAAYLQAEAAAVAAALTQTRQRLLAIESAMRAHGLIN